MKIPQMTPKAIRFVEKLVEQLQATGGNTSFIAAFDQAIELLPQESKLRKTLHSQTNEIHDYLTNLETQIQQQTSEEQVLAQKLGPAADSRVFLESYMRTCNPKTIVEEIEIIANAASVDSCSGGLTPLFANSGSQFRGNIYYLDQIQSKVDEFLAMKTLEGDVHAAFETVYHCMMKVMNIVCFRKKQQQYIKFLVASGSQSVYNKASEDVDAAEFGSTLVEFLSSTLMISFCVPEDQSKRDQLFTATIFALNNFCDSAAAKLDLCLSLHDLQASMPNKPVDAAAITKQVNAFHVRMLGELVRVNAEQNPQDAAEIYLRQLVLYRVFRECLPTKDVAKPCSKFIMTHPKLPERVVQWLTASDDVEDTIAKKILQKNTKKGATAYLLNAKGLDVVEMSTLKHILGAYLSRTEETSNEEALDTASSEDLDDGETQPLFYIDSAGNDETKIEEDEGNVSDASSNDNDNDRRSKRAKLAH